MNTETHSQIMYRKLEILEHICLKEISPPDNTHQGYESPVKDPEGKEDTKETTASKHN